MLTLSKFPEGTSTLQKSPKNLNLKNKDLKIKETPNGFISVREYIRTHNIPKDMLTGSKQQLNYAFSCTQQKLFQSKV